MPSFNVSYDLHSPNANYDALFKELKKCSGWYHCLKSTWLVSTTESAGQLYERLRKVLKVSDRLLVIGVTKEHQGWLPKSAWEWINRHS